jgi:hypothetical protein
MDSFRPVWAWHEVSKITIQSKVTRTNESTDREKEEEEEVDSGCPWNQREPCFGRCYRSCTRWRNDNRNRHSGQDW